MRTRARGRAVTAALAWSELHELTADQARAVSGANADDWLAAWLVAKTAPAGGEHDAAVARACALLDKGWVTMRPAECAGR